MEAFVLRWIFHDYYFLVQIFATSMMMAASNRVESSFGPHPYQSPRRHDYKNIKLHLPADQHDTFAAFFKAAPNSFTS